MRRCIKPRGTDHPCGDFTGGHSMGEPVLVGQERKTLEQRLGGRLALVQVALQREQVLWTSGYLAMPKVRIRKVQLDVSFCAHAHSSVCLRLGLATAHQHVFPGPITGRGAQCLSKANSARATFL